MPFKLQITGVDYRDAEIAISGKLVAGAFAGPEAVVIHGQNGVSATAVVTHHSVYSPVDWPVLPSHDSTILTLSIDAPSSDFRVDETQSVIGRGTVFENPDRAEISYVVSDPVFWAMQLSRNLDSEDVEEPNETYFGVCNQRLNDFYREQIDSKFDAGIWPYIRLPIDDFRFVEIEFAAGVEYQDRFWIGDSRIPRRVLLGYHSGHFSLPAFRLEEVEWFHEVLSRSPLANRTATLLLMSGCCVESPSDQLIQMTMELFSEIPGVKSDAMTAMATAFVGSLIVPSLRWERDKDFGWINNWRYSQRNPESTMSVLSRDDFAFISKFF